MKTDRLAYHSRFLATATLVLIVAMLLVNAACWFFPSQMSGYGLDFNLTSMTGRLKADTLQMPLWQISGGIVLSSIPLLILAKGLLALRRLFQSYSRGEYFAPESAELLGSVGKYVSLWVLFSCLLEPIMSVWITFLRPAGDRLLSFGFSSSQLVALFLAASVMIVARGLHDACVLARENQQFV